MGAALGMLRKSQEPLLTLVVSKSNIKEVAQDIENFVKKEEWTIGTFHNSTLSEILRNLELAGDDRSMHFSASHEIIRWQKFQIKTSTLFERPLIFLIFRVYDIIPILEGDQIYFYDEKIIIETTKDFTVLAGQWKNVFRVITKEEFH